MSMNGRNGGSGAGERTLVARRLSYNCNDDIKSRTRMKDDLMKEFEQLNNVTAGKRNEKSLF